MIDKRVSRNPGPFANQGARVDVFDFHEEPGTKLEFGHHQPEGDGHHGVARVVVCVSLGGLGSESAVGDRRDRDPQDVGEADVLDWDEILAQSGADDDVDAAGFTPEQLSMLSQ